jgi:3-oxoacyl-[acyl-carrier protein] reductase
MKYADIKIGDKAEVVHTITDNDISKFVELTGDDNKLHVNKEFASKTEFKKPVVHGMLGASFISTLIGTKLPGDGALWFSQTLEFLKPVRVGDTIKVLAEVISKNDKSNVIELKTDIINQNKQLVTTGISKIKVVNVFEEKIENNRAIEIDQLALIVGASGGVGKATAIKLANDGFDLILHYNSNESVISEIVKEISKIGRKASVIKADLLNTIESENLINRLLRDHRNLTAYVNCSTLKIPNVKFQDLNWEEMQRHFDINIKSNFFMLKEILSLLESNKYGKVVLLSTLYTELYPSELLHYNTAKSALNGFAKTLAMEFASKKININLVSPSMMDTDLISEVPTKSKLLTEAKTPLKRLCTTDDVANAISFLVSNNSNFITGETIRINGGQIMI